MATNLSRVEPPILARVVYILLGIAVICCPPTQATAQERPRFVDLSLLVSPEYPCTWPTFPRFQLNAEERIGPLSPYNSDIIIIDGNTGTQLDVPPHSVTPPDSGFSNAGSFGRSYTDVVPAWQFGGEACVIDCRDLVDAAPPGRSPLIGKERVIAWEKAHRPLGPGDVVLFFSAYSDRYYRPMPEGRRFGADPLEGKSPGWPGPDPDCMEYLAGRKVMTLGIDSTSMGPIPDLGEPTHFAGLKHGMIWAESATGLGQLPATGAFFCMLGPKYAGGIYSELRAFAVVGDPLAKRLIDSARKRNVVDLSVVMAEDRPVSWPGRGVGNHRQLFTTIRWGINPNTRAPFEMHMLDGQSGTHLVPPAYALPPSGFDNATYSPEVKTWLAEYEAKYGRRGTSDVTTEKVPISQTCGPARVIDVSNLIGKTDKARWPASPEITPELIRRDEARNGELHPNDIVIFRSEWSDRYSRPFPEGKACLDDPLNGRSEGWPAPGPEAIAYLATKGIRCVATDAPTLGGVDPKRALMTYWALGSRGMVGVEYVTNLDRMPRGAYFLFAAVKINGGHGGHGRAIAMY
ncbi:MAG: cyclase family protein [Isosphaeraceae bacterium]